jgi:hypothetical protein
MRSLQLAHLSFMLLPQQAIPCITRVMHCPAHHLHLSPTSTYLGRLPRVMPPRARLAAPLTSSLSDPRLLLMADSTCREGGKEGSSHPAVTARVWAWLPYPILSSTTLSSTSRE